LSLRWYQEFFGNPAWVQATQVSFGVAALTVLIATPLGVAAAYAIANAQHRMMRLVHAVLRSVSNVDQAHVYGLARRDRPDDRGDQRAADRGVVPADGDARARGVIL